VRWVIACLLLAAPRGEASPEPTPRATTGDAGDFWRDVIEPNGDQVRKLIDKAKKAMREPETASTTSDSEWAVDQRMRFHRDAYNLLRHARKLSPENTEVLTLLGRAADEVGRTREAIDALETCVRRWRRTRGCRGHGPTRRIYLRLGQRDTAIRWLRHAQASPAMNAPSLVHLANALAARGEVTAAIDTLQTALPSQVQGYYAQELTLIAFALAVVYDRDEQRGAAFEILITCSTPSPRSTRSRSNELVKLRFAPAEDEHLSHCSTSRSTTTPRRALALTPPAVMHLAGVR
jgi:tetratricopeptide (TPR) repeat protein